MRTSCHSFSILHSTWWRWIRNNDDIFQSSCCSLLIFGLEVVIGPELRLNSRLIQHHQASKRTTVERHIFSYYRTSSHHQSKKILESKKQRTNIRSAQQASTSHTKNFIWSSSSMWLASRWRNRTLLSQLDEMNSSLLALLLFNLVYASLRTSNLIVAGIKFCSEEEGGGVCPDNSKCCRIEVNHSNDNLKADEGVTAKVSSSGCLPMNRHIEGPGTCCGDTTSFGGTACAGNYQCAFVNSENSGDHGADEMRENIGCCLILSIIHN